MKNTLTCAALLILATLAVAGLIISLKTDDEKPVNQNYELIVLQVLSGEKPEIDNVDAFHTSAWRMEYQGKLSDDDVRRLRSVKFVPVLPPPAEVAPTE